MQVAPLVFSPTNGCNSLLVVSVRFSCMSLPFLSWPHCNLVQITAPCYSAYLARQKALKSKQTNNSPMPQRLLMIFMWWTPSKKTKSKPTISRTQLFLTTATTTMFLTKKANWLFKLKKIYRLLRLRKTHSVQILKSSLEKTPLWCLQ